MNCVRCNAPLEPEARFCRNCGLAVATTLEQRQPSRQPAQQYDVTRPQPSSQQSWSPTPQAQQQWQSSEQDQPTLYAQAPSSQQGQPQSNQQNRQTQPTSYETAHQYQTNPPGTFQQPPAPSKKPRKRRGIGGCLLTTFGVLVAIIIVLGLAWSFVVRPYLHNLAVQQLDQAMTQAVNQLPQVPSSPVPIPGGVPKTQSVTDTILNNAIALNVSPSDPVQHINVHITPNNIVTTFQINGIPSTITGVPQVQGNKLVFTNVTISGIAGLVLSPDDISSLVNRHLSDALTRTNSQAQSIALKDGEMDVTLLLGAGNGG